MGRGKSRSSRQNHKWSNPLADPVSQLCCDFVEGFAIEADVPFVTALPIRLGSDSHLLPVIAEEADNEPHAISGVRHALANESGLPRRHEEACFLIADVDRVALGQEIRGGPKRGGL